MPTNASHRRRAATAAAASCALIASAIVATPAAAQPAQPTLFVSNNGNLEGSVSSFVIEPDGSLTLVDTIVTGTRDSLSDPCPGCNAYNVAVSPNGAHIAVSHAPDNNPTKRITFFAVNEDSTLTPVADDIVPTTPLDLLWIDDERLAITASNFGNTQVGLYAFDADAGTLGQLDITPIGVFGAAVAYDPASNLLFAESSLTGGGNGVRAFNIADDELLQLDMVNTGSSYVLGLGLAPDGEHLYGGGGISGSGNDITGLTVDTATGALEFIPGSPFTSPGSSPKWVHVSSDGAYAIVGHGTDATVRTFAIDAATGALTATGRMFDVGSQGTLGEGAMLGDLIFFTDNSTIFDDQRGVYSFTLNPDGSLAANGPLVDSGGISPNGLAAWAPTGDGVPADLDDDGDVGVGDLLLLLGAWGACDDPRTCPADLDSDSDVTVADLLILLSAWSA